MQGAELKQWTRDTPWRQGQVLDSAAATALGLVNALEGATIVVVISHDCDLANDDLDVEPNVEVIVGRQVMIANGNCTWGKAPRTLHFPMFHQGSEIIVELVATAKHTVKKSDLAQSDPDLAFALDGRGVKILRSWLSSRYDRSAFSDAFVERLKETKLSAKLAKILEPKGALISSVYFDIDEGKLYEREAGDPYALRIVLLYPPGVDPEESANAADSVVEKVEILCQELLKSGTEILLKGCMAISEDDMPISQAKLLMQWRLEHMTHKADAANPCD